MNKLIAVIMLVCTVAIGETNTIIFQRTHAERDAITNMATLHYQFYDNEMSVSGMKITKVVTTNEFYPKQYKVWSDVSTGGLDTGTRFNPDVKIIETHMIIKFTFTHEGKPFEVTLKDEVIDSKTYVRKAEVKWEAK